MNHCLECVHFRLRGYPVGHAKGCEKHILYIDPLLENNCQFFHVTKDCSTSFCSEVAKYTNGKNAACHTYDNQKDTCKYCWVKYPEALRGNPSDLKNEFDD